MATNYDMITNFYKGEAVEFTLLAKNPDGTVITTPLLQTLILTIGSSINGAPELEFDDKHTVVDESLGKYQLLLSAANVSALVEGKTYYYNLWSKLAAADPRLQAYGKILLQKSIEPAP